MTAKVGSLSFLSAGKSGTTGKCVWLEPVRGRAGFLFSWEGRMSEEKGEADGALPRITANKGRVLQQAAPSGRKLFDAARKARFLEFFTGSANLSWAAREAGVNYRTVLRHRAEDPVFAEAYDLAEAQSVPRLRAWLAEAAEAEEERKRLADAALGQRGEEEGSDEEEPGGDTAPARLSVEQAMQFLRDHEQSQARRERAARMGPGRGNGRPVSVASNEEVKEALFKALRAHGIRVRASTSSPEKPGEEAPPPSCGRSPSPGNPGEDLE
ncbi:MAG: hypothetical protein QOJ91_278 [Sphingomonadales bacterium]|jgi:hypothetical protein|nr:hypothetical protein [Sphingomonadales bacterium]